MLVPHTLPCVFEKLSPKGSLPSLLYQVWNQRNNWGRHSMRTHRCAERGGTESKMERFTLKFSTQSRLRATWLIWQLLLSLVLRKTSLFCGRSQHWNVLACGALRLKWTCVWEREIGMQTGRRKLTPFLPPVLIPQGRNFQQYLTQKSEKTLMLGMIEGGRRGPQRMR